MQKLSRYWHIIFGVILTSIAGYIDAIGFIKIGGLYASFMSGNTIQIGIAISNGQIHVALMPLLLVLAFGIGSMTGGVLTALVPARWDVFTVLGFETAAVAAAFAAAFLYAEVGITSLFLALAMGLQNAVLAHVRGFRAGTTFVTGALFSFGHKMALALSGKGELFGWVGDGAVWLAFLIGAAAGAFAHEQLGLYVLVAPTCTAATLLLIALLIALRTPITSLAN